jgi:hypothetical protein
MGVPTLLGPLEITGSDDGNRYSFRNVDVLETFDDGQRAKM